MKPFSFHSPTGLGEAVDLLDRFGPGAQVIAGGQTLLLALKDRSTTPSALVSLAGIAELRGLRHTASGALEIGAATSYATLAAARLPGWHAEVARVAGDLADRPVRTMGTIGGALCAAEPRFDMVTLAVGVDAELDLTGPGGARTVTAAAFLDPAGGTARAPGEILTTVRLPPPGRFAGVAFEKYRHRVFDAALVSAVCALAPRGPARLTVGAVHPAPALATAAAAGLGTGTPSEIDAMIAAMAAGRAAADEVLPAASATSPHRRYQRELIGVLVGRAVARAARQGGR